MSGRYYRRSGYRRWYNRGGRYYGRNRRYYSTNNSRSNGNLRAARQQADQATFNLNIPSQLSAFSYKANPQGNTYGVFALNIYDLLRRSEFFQNYAGMYDEFKVDKVKVKLLPTTWATALGQGNPFYKNLTVYTAWDRTGLNDNQCVFSVPTPAQIDRIGDNDYRLGNESGGGLAIIIGSDITSYSSAESRVLNPNTNTTITRWLNPKTIQEKSQWLSTTTLKKWYEKYDNVAGRYYGIIASSKDGKYVDNDLSVFNQILDSNGQVGTVNGILEAYTSPMNSDNPCSLFEDNGIKFKPTLLVGVYPDDSNTIQVPTDVEGVNIQVPANRITFNVEADVVCTFRGLRKSRVLDD